MNAKRFLIRRDLVLGAAICVAVVRISFCALQLSVCRSQWNAREPHCLLLKV